MLILERSKLSEQIFFFFFISSKHYHSGYDRWVGRMLEPARLTGWVVGCLSGSQGRRVDVRASRVRKRWTGHLFYFITK